MKFFISFLAFLAATAALAFPFNNTSIDNVTAVPTVAAVSDNDIYHNNDNNLKYKYFWDETVYCHHNDRRSLSDPKSANKAMNAGNRFISYAGKKMFGGKLKFISANLFFRTK